MNCTASRRVLVRIGPAAHSSNLCIMDLHWLPSLPSNHPLPQPCFPRPLPKSTTCTHTLVSRFASGGTQPKTVGKMGQGKLARIIIPGERVQAGRRQEIRDASCSHVICLFSPRFPKELQAVRLFVLACPYVTSVLPTAPTSALSADFTGEPPTPCPASYFTSALWKPSSHLSQ